MAVSKVVRLEELTSNGHSSDEKQLALLTDKTGIQRDAKDKINALATIGAEEEEDDIPSEAGNTLPPVPDGWPRLPRIFEHGSWEFTSAVSPSINKATYHLELLQNILEQWCDEAGQDVRSQHGSSLLTRNPCASIAASRKRLELHFESSPLPDKPEPLKRTGTSSSVASHLRAATSASQSSDTSQSLSVTGMGAKPRPDEGYGGKALDDLPHLGIGDVLGEVILLLARLETDRQETLQGLQKERERVKMLAKKIDNYAEQRMAELGAAVQREHEACALDIYELNWHVGYRGRNEGRIKGRVDVAQVLNTRLQEDIEFVKKHVPLVQEKLDLEQDAMARIQHAQADTDAELALTIDRYNKVEVKSKDAHSKAAQERAAIQKDLEAVKKDLSRISEELSQAKMTYTSYIHQCNEYRQQLKDNEQELLVLQVKCENAKTNEAMATTKVKDLEERIKEEEFKHSQLQTENSKIEKELKQNDKNFTKIENDLIQEIADKEEELRLLKRQNQELEMDMEDCSDKIKKCIRQKDADDKNLERMKKELARTEKQIEVTLQDLAGVTIINAATHEQLVKQQDKCLQGEEALKATVEALRKQVKEEIHSKTVMAARINSDSTDLVKSQAETKHKKEKVAKKAEEVKHAVQMVLDKVVRLRSAHAEKSKEIEKLKAKMRELEKQNAETDKEFTHKIGELKPQHEALKEEIMLVDKQLSSMAWKSEMMTKKLEDMSSSSNMITKAYDNAQRTIASLQENLTEVEMQIKSSQHLEDQLRISLNSLTARMRDRQKKHSDLMSERGKCLDQYERDLKVELSKNTQLASQYRTLQNKHVYTKNQLLNKYDERVKFENAIKDVKQLQGLQMRMHTALLAYYKYRGLYNDSELGRMEQDSTYSAVRVGELQRQMDMALMEITDFLQNQLDGDTIRNMAMQKVEEEYQPTKADPAAVPKLNKQTRGFQPNPVAAH